MRNQWKLFKNMTKEWNFDPFWGPKWPDNQAPGAYILRTSKSNYNEHV